MAHAANMKESYESIQLLLGKIKYDEFKWKLCGDLKVVALLVGISGVPRGGVWGVQTPPPPKFRRYRRSPRSHEQEEPASRFPFVVHCVLTRL